MRPTPKVLPRANYHTTHKIFIRDVLPDEDMKSPSSSTSLFGNRLHMESLANLLPARVFTVFRPQAAPVIMIGFTKRHVPSPMSGGSGQTTAGAHTMPNFIKTAAVAVAAALACAVAGAADFSAQTIRLAHTAAVSHAHHEAALQLAKNVSERTGGKVKVEIYPAGELGDQPALAEQVTLGALDSAVVSLGNLAMYSKKLNAMTAPFLFKDYDHAHRTIDAFVMPWMNEGLAQHDAVGLSMFDYGFRQTTTKGVPVNSAADLKGVKIRVPPATGLLAAFDAVGANTQKIAYSELYTSLKQGVVTGEENPVFTILADSLFETQDELALTNHYFDCQVLLFNKMFLDGLQPELQAILKEEAVKAQNLTRDRISHGEAAVIEELKKKGMHVTNPDRDSFVKLMKPAYDKIGELAGKDEMKRLLDAVEANRAK